MSREWCCFFGLDFMIAYRIVDRCIACGVCLDACERDAILTGDIYRILTERCGGCGMCADVCPVDAAKPSLVDDFAVAANS